MGTYISISGWIEFKTEDRPKILQALKDLNKNDEIKRGGSFGPSSERKRWFSWMDENYDEKVESVEDVFLELLENIYTEKIDDGEERIKFDYNNKWGQHEPFFFAIAPYLTDMMIHHYCDEFEVEDQQWRIVLDKKNKTAHTLYPKVTVVYPEISDANLSTVEKYQEEMAPYWR